MKIDSFLMGSEVEYSLSGRPHHSRFHRIRYHELLLEEMQKSHRWLTDIRGSSGVYLDNGSRYYLDSGCHNEFSSPEVLTPQQIATYDRASEQILLRAKSAVEARTAELDLCITKNNVNFHLPDRAAWGQHEAYTCWIPLESAAEQLIPHLVSRLPYAAAGCLSAAAHGGFELSQRARHIRRKTGTETTRDRAIFCTRAMEILRYLPLGLDPHEPDLQGFPTVFVWNVPQLRGNRVAVPDCQRRPSRGAQCSIEKPGRSDAGIFVGSLVQNGRLARQRASGDPARYPARLRERSSTLRRERRLSRLDLRGVPALVNDARRAGAQSTPAGKSVGSVLEMADLRPTANPSRNELGIASTSSRIAARNFDGWLQIVCCERCSNRMAPS